MQIINKHPYNSKEDINATGFLSGRKRSLKRTKFGNTIEGFSFLGSSPIVLLVHQQAQQCCVCVQVLFVNADNPTGCLTLNLSGSVGEREKSPNFSHISEKPQCTTIIKKVHFVAIAFHERKWFLVYVCILSDAPKQCFYCYTKLL
jgi:hypothetical protein